MLRRTLTVGLAAIALGLAACGDDDDDENGAAAPPPPPAETQATTPETGGAGAGDTVALAADPGGDLAFDKEELEAEAGGLTIELTNESTTPHNVVLERDGEDVAETETIMESNTSTTAEVEAGEYTFYCSVGNHREAGMEGTLTVE